MHPRCQAQRGRGRRRSAGAGAARAQARGRSAGVCERGCARERRAQKRRGAPTLPGPRLAWCRRLRPCRSCARASAPACPPPRRALSAAARALAAPPRALAPPSPPPPPHLPPPPPRPLPSCWRASPVRPAPAARSLPRRIRGRTSRTGQQAASPARPRHRPPPAHPLAVAPAVRGQRAAADPPSASRGAAWRRAQKHTGACTGRRAPAARRPCAPPCARVA